MPRPARRAKFEKAEHALLQRLNSLHIPMVQVTTQNNLSDALNKAVKHVLKQASYFAISIDLDAIDPQDAPAVSMPELEVFLGRHCVPLFTSLTMTRVALVLR